MPGTPQGREVGSNLSKAVGFIGMDELERNIKEAFGKISGEYMAEALYAGAEVFKTALEGSAPVASGRARGSVIIYRRRERGLTSASDKAMPLLIGFEKPRAYYMYWVETGHAKKGGGRVAGRGFAAAVYDGVSSAAFAAAESILRGRLAG